MDTLRRGRELYSEMEVERATLGEQASQPSQEEQKEIDLATAAAQVALPIYERKSS